MRVDANWTRHGEIVEAIEMAGDARRKEIVMAAIDLINEEDGGMSTDVNRALIKLRDLVHAIDPAHKRYIDSQPSDF